MSKQLLTLLKSLKYDSIPSHLQHIYYPSLYFIYLKYLKIIYSEQLNPLYFKILFFHFQTIILKYFLILMCLNVHLDN